MKTETVSEKDNFFEDVEMRYHNATLLEKDKGVYFRIDQCDYADTAKIIDPEINTNNLRIGKTYPIFLLRPSDNKKNWFASLEWADKEKNPWENQSHSLVDLVEGTVVRYVREIGAVVRLKDGIEAFLHINEVQGLANAKSNNIRNILYIGDKIYAEIIKFSIEYLDCELSIKKMYKRKKESDRRYKHSELFTRDDSNVLEKKFIPYSKNTQIVIIDDNIEFAKTLKTWLSHQNVHCRISTEIEEIEKFIKRTNESHVILDYDLEDNNLEEKITQILCKYKPHVLLCSSHREAKKKIKEYPNWFYTPKPFSNKTLDNFLRNRFEKLKNIEKIKHRHITNRRRAEGMWEAAFPEIADLIERVDAFIKDICQGIDALAGIWIKSEREGVFSIRAQYGIDTKKPEFKKLEAGLVHTIVLDTMEESTAIKKPIDKAGPLLREIAPEHARSIFTFPINTTETKQVDRILLFFCKENFHFQQAIKSLHNNLLSIQLFIENFTLLEHIEELRAFAPLGLASASLSHELANRVAPIQNILNDFVTLTSEGGTFEKLEKALKYDNLCKQLPTLQKAVDKMAGMIRTNLLIVRKKKENKYSLQEIIEQIATIMSYATFSKKKKRADKIPIHLELPKKDIWSSLPRINVEQPLVNLIDNAIFKIKEQGWGRIIIRLKIGKDPQTPIHIEVEDNGYGVNADEMTLLFKPRKTSRSTQGNGLGLFISKKMIELIGGKLETPATHRWQNTIFTLKLPKYFGDDLL
ncbi:putative Histidine kinase [Candidatus Desulfarcum epimagneticum]|uniref:histidine kinase n=1 Tax=uncultured Desulfobacteraceae bacterium TaxID=218296 RepID=A0A484HQS0_9BACT|nr:putative Histidine kinase [uncultured Desulfobacteraceae bacterium]